MRVDFPAPFSPSTAWIVPVLTVRWVPAFATTPGNRFQMPIRAPAGTMAVAVGAESII